MKTNQNEQKPFNKPAKIRNIIWVAGILGIGLCQASNPVWAENTGNQSSNNSPVKKPDDGKGRLPTFAQADVNGDHYVTKKELQNFPYLLQVFDKVDAGHDGKLEQHEYQNLEMETKREGEIK